MQWESALAALGLGELVADEAFVAQIGLMAASTILFLCSIVVCGMAFRAAGAARRARREALDLAVEVRHLTAQVEKATARRRSEPAETAGEFAGEAIGEAEASAPDPALEEAKQAATVPSALLSSFVRRRS